MQLRNRNRTAMFRIIMAPIAWVLFYVCAMVVLAMLFASTAMVDKIPVGLVMLAIASVCISIPINLAIHGIVLEHIFRLKLKRTGTIELTFVVVAAASTLVGLSSLDFWRDLTVNRKLLFALPITVASVATCWLHCMLMPTRVNKQSA